MPREDDLLSLLQRIGDNEAYLDLLVKQVRSPGGVVPFVGAGMSVPFRFPSWRDFLLQQAPDAATRERLEKRLAEGEYEEAAEDLFVAGGGNAFQANLAHVFGPDHLAGQPLTGAVTHLPRLASGRRIARGLRR